MDKFLEAAVTVALMIGAIAIVALIVSPKATTSQVIQSIASGYGNDIAVAISPVTGTNVTPNLSYPNSSGSTSGWGVGLPSYGGGLPTLN